VKFVRKREESGRGAANHIVKIISPLFARFAALLVGLGVVSSVGGKEKQQRCRRAIMESFFFEARFLVNSCGLLCRLLCLLTS
jgi:hypothetical protein